MENIKDKLNHWAKSNGYWAECLLYISINGNEIQNEDLEDIIKCYENKNFKSIPANEFNTLSTEKIYLSRIKNIKGVNKLLDNQTLNFNNNLSVIYGSNGTGKTGYVRIIKSIGDCLDKENTIYSDLTHEEIFDHSAEIVYQESNNYNTISWQNDSKDKLNIKVFNSNCVQFSLGKTKEIQFIPQDFNVFNIINSATIELVKLAKTSIESLNNSLNEYGIISATNVSNFISDLTSTISVDNQISNFINKGNYKIIDINNKIDELETKSKSLNVQAIDNETKVILRLKKEIENIISFIFVKSILYNKKFWDDYKDILNKSSNLIHNNVKIEDFISNINLDKKQKQLLKEFILSADELLKSKGISSFENEEFCLFCGQHIEANSKAKELLRCYSNFITNDNTREIYETHTSIEEHKSKLNKAISEIDKINIVIKEYDIVIHQTISDYIQKLNKLLELKEENEVDENTYSSLYYIEDYKEYFDQTIIDLENKLVELNKIRGTIDQGISVNRAELNELKSIKILLDNKDKIIDILQRIINLTPITKISNSSLSAIQSKILVTNYKDNFKKTLNDNLKLLDAPKSIKFEPSIVSSRLSLKQKYLDKKYNLSSILSEGEQKVVSLAHFIAENSMEDKDNILVFDDPVNSLDLQRMELVSRVLVNLSLQKQIIIFTHNLVFVGFLSSLAKEMLNDKQTCFICVEKTFIKDEEYTGLIKYEFPNVETYKNYKTSINIIMANATEKSLDKSKMYECFNYIRSATELLVVEKVLNGTINRYEPDIKMTRFGNIKSNVLHDNIARISALFTKVCRFIPAHSSSPQARIEPDFNTLNESWDELKSLEKVFN